jgi:hypothetical protein
VIDTETGVFELAGDRGIDGAAIAFPYKNVAWKQEKEG